MKVLLIDDDKVFSKIIEKAVRTAGHTFTYADTGKQALLLLKDKLKKDIILLDVVLPDYNGIELCKEIRSADPITPIIILSGKSSSIDKIAGLKAGSDDYVVKPFDTAELLARIDAIMKRVYEKESAPQKIKRREISVDMRRYVAKVGEVEIELTNTELKLLYLLLKNDDKITSREEILEFVWDIKGYEIMSNSIDVHITKLRSKLRLAGLQNVIQTVRGIGYKLNLG